MDIIKPRLNRLWCRRLQTLLTSWAKMWMALWWPTWSKHVTRPKISYTSTKCFHHNRNRQIKMMAFNKTWYRTSTKLPVLMFLSKSVLFNKCSQTTCLLLVSANSSRTSPATRRRNISRFTSIIAAEPTPTSTRSTTSRTLRTSTHRLTPIVISNKMTPRTSRGPPIKRRRSHKAMPTIGTASTTRSHLPSKAKSGASPKSREPNSSSTVCKINKGSNPSKITIQVLSNLDTQICQILRL